MDKEKFDVYLKERYYDQINWYDRKSLTNKKWYERLQFALIIFSALTPVLIAISMQPSIESWWLRWSPIITSVIVSMLTGVIKTFKFQENLLNYRTICETLRKEIHFFEADIGDYKDVENKYALFIEKVENLISRENTLWTNIVKDDKNGGT